MRVRIVIVEDEIKIREGMSKLIQQHTEHIVVGEAKNGEEGLSLILRHKPDLVITDILMPVMDGLVMLERLQELGIKIHAVILSGYSEFEYAKKAIHLGVKDYLLKPIAAEDVQQVLEHIEQKIVQEKNALKGTPQSCIRDAIMGSTEYSEEILKAICHFTDTMEYIIFLGCTDGAKATYSNEYMDKIQRFQDRFPSVLIYSFYLETTREIVTLMAGELPYKEIKEYFEKRILLPYKGKKEQTLWCMEKFKNIGDLPIIFKQLQAILRYGISLGGDMLITNEMVSNLTGDDYNYPIEIENKIKSAICNGQLEDLEKYKVEFFDYMKEKLYEPDSIIDGYMRLYTATANLIQEIDTKTYELLNNKHVLKRMGATRTRYELEEAYSSVIQLLMNAPGKREDIRNYTIKRALNYIKSHYKEGITLEEVADHLDITPEYLCTLFNKEIGMNFSVFLRDFRLSHAKRLLKGTNMKIYEIAAEVGYSDPKYFIRVFKENIGIPPGEFREKF